MSMTYPSEFDNIVAKAKADSRKMRVAIAVGLCFENAHQNVFHEREDAVGNIFVKGHAAAKGAASEDARTERAVVEPVSDHRGHRGDQ